MSEEEKKIKNFRVRKFPEEIEDGEIDLYLKEWKLVGCDMAQEGKTVVVHDPDRGSVHDSAVVYQKCGGSWYILDTAMANKLTDSLEKSGTPWDGQWTPTGSTGVFGATGAVQPGGFTRKRKR